MKFWLICAILLIVELEDCLGRPRYRSKDYDTEKRRSSEYRRPQYNSEEDYQDSSPEHVIKVQKGADGIVVGNFDGFTEDNDISSSSYLSANQNGRQGRRRSRGNQRRSRYSKEDSYDNDGYGGKKKDVDLDSDYGFSDKSQESYSSRDNNYGSRDNSYSKSDNYDNNYGNSDNNGGYDNDKDDYYSSRRSKGRRTSRNDGYSDSNKGYSSNRNSQRSRSRGYNRDNYHNGGNSYGRRGNNNYNQGGGSDYGATRGMTDVEAAHALYTGNPNHGHANLDGIVNNKPVYLGEYDEKSPQQGKPRTQIGDYLYGEDMVF